MKLLRSVYGEPAPLILHPRLRPLRLAHIRVKFAVQRALGRPRTPPAYLRPEMSDDQDEELLRACENFMGARGGNADQQRAYRARAMEDLINDPTVPETRKKLLRAERDELMNPDPAIDLAAAPTGDFPPEPDAASGSIPAGEPVRGAPIHPEDHKVDDKVADKVASAG